MKSILLSGIFSWSQSVSVHFSTTPPCFFPGRISTITIITIIITITITIISVTTKNIFTRRKVHKKVIDHILSSGKEVILLFRDEDWRIFSLKITRSKDEVAEFTSKISNKDFSVQRIGWQR